MCPFRWHKRVSKEPKRIYLCCAYLYTEQATATYCIIQGMVVDGIASTSPFIPLHKRIILATRAGNCNAIMYAETVIICDGAVTVMIRSLFVAMGGEESHWLLVSLPTS
jgi:hypothetical protein